jgi:hypothetical protein
MQSNIFSTKAPEIISKIIDKFMVASGTMALVWILGFLLVAMID